MTDQNDAGFDDFMSGQILRIFFLGAPLSGALLHALGKAALAMMLKGHEIQGSKALLDPATPDAIRNAQSMERIELSAGKKAGAGLEEIAIVAAASLRDLLRDPAMVAALKTTAQAMECQRWEISSTEAAVKLAAAEVVLKDAQTYREVVGHVAYLAARKAAIILGTRPETLPPSK